MCVKSDSDNYKKLAKVVKYLQGTKLMGLTLEADSPIIVKWFINSSFAVHPNMCSHTRGLMSMGSRAAHTLHKQKSNMQSLTESELVAINDVLGQVL